MRVASLVSPAFAAIVLVSVLSDPARSEERSDIVIPSIEFADTPIKDAIDFLVQRSRELDVEESDPQKRGVNVVLIGDFSETSITLRLSRVPLGETVRVLADLADAELEIREEVILIRRGSTPGSVTREEGSEALEAKLREIRIPNIEFQETPLGDAIDFLGARSVELDTEADSNKRGVNLVLKQTHPREVTLRLRNVTLYTALEMIALATGNDVQIREHLVYIDGQ